jgi:hypothetical protein
MTQAHGPFCIRNERILIVDLTFEGCKLVSQFQISTVEFLCDDFLENGECLDRASRSFGYIMCNIPLVWNFSLRRLRGGRAWKVQSMVCFLVRHGKLHRETYVWIPLLMELTVEFREPT